MNGWIKLHRQICDNQDWLSEPFTRGQAWVDLLLLANHADGFLRVRGVKMPVKRGQCGWSAVKLSSRWQWSRGKVNRFLKELETAQQIVQQKNNVTCLITIVKYNEYQLDGTTDGTASSTASSTTDGQQAVQQTDTNKKDKKVKKDKNDKNEKEIKKELHDSIISSVTFPQDFDAEMKELFLDWCGSRRDMKEYITARIIKSHFKSLSGFMKCDIVAAYTQAIQSNWKAVFPKKLSAAEGGIDMETRKILEKM